MRTLVSRPSVDPWVLFDSTPTMFLPTAEFLAACGWHRRDVGAGLVVLDIESDCYPVVCLRAAQAEKLTALAGRAGFTARSPGD
ncbi:hypothetical protein [Streptomyces sp. NBC_01363]|uniref:DUF6630 family protein n=1 Tax=Streptomyces sp. NBC_01363 TaxID=2903840 RepID=UPI00224F1482|nr:hypothetical protein [Streptomyces sp. NBC_01363]MCX4733857.1 hypothetical protein [Streptomyces sp. NBC_01363]